jgi:hypothetical protein
MSSDSDSIEDEVQNHLKLFPRLDDLPASLRTEVITLADFSIEDHLRKAITVSRNTPPKGCTISDLPNELLSYIFCLGTLESEAVSDGEWEDDDEEDYDLVHSFDALDEDEEEEVEEEEEEEDEEGDFELEGEMNANSYLRSTHCELPFQVLVSHVCKHWREVAIESPSLWTSITFNGLIPMDRSKTWIERSKSLPLRIRMDYAEDSELLSPEDTDSDSVAECIGMESHKLSEVLPSEDDINTILDIILPCVSRWHSLRIIVPIYAPMYQVLSRLATCSSAPILEDLLLQHLEEFDDLSETFQPAALRDSFLLFNGNAPNLKILTLWGVHIDWTSPFLSGLRELELAYHADDIRPSYSQFTHCLRSSPNIESLSLYLSGPSGHHEDWLMDEVIELPSLVNMGLAYHPPEYMGPLLKQISTPNLASLALDFDGADCSTFARQLAGPTPSSRKSLLAGLVQLKISGLPCDHNTIDVLYAELSNLRHITLNCRFLDGVFFFKLANPIPSSACPTTIPASTQMYCPRLETITTTGITGKEMIMFVEARVAAGCPVRKVCMGEADEVETSDHYWLKK